MNSDDPTVSLTPEQQLPKQPPESLSSLHRSLRVDILENGPWDMKVANTFCALGNKYIRAGRLLEGLAMFEKDLQVCLHNLGDSDIRVAGAKYNVGLARCRTGHYLAAIPHLEDALRIRTGTLGPSHLLVADVLTCLGGAYCCTGRNAEALDIYQRDVSIRKAASASDPSARQLILPMALSLRNSASARTCLGQTDLAIAECGEAHAIMVAQLGAAHPLAAKTQILLAALAAGTATGPVAPQVPVPVMLAACLPFSRAAHAAAISTAVRQQQQQRFPARPGDSDASGHEQSSANARPLNARAARARRAGPSLTARRGALCPQVAPSLQPAQAGPAQAGRPPAALDPAAWDLLRIHNHATARVETRPPGPAPAAVPPGRPGAAGRRLAERRWRDTVDLARDIITALRVSMPT
jgi:tetratricopeptide (TPR) repeat protein